MEFPIEKFAVYHLSKKAKAIIKEGSRAVTITKRINPVAEASIRISGDELAMLFHVLNMRTLTEEAIKNLTDKSTEKGGDHAEHEPE